MIKENFERVSNGIHIIYASSRNTGHMLPTYNRHLFPTSQPVQLIGVRLPNFKYICQAPYLLSS